MHPHPALLDLQPEILIRTQQTTKGIDDPSFVVSRNSEDHPNGGLF
jgi:hypothetical protein